MISVHKRIRRDKNYFSKFILYFEKFLSDSVTYFEDNILERGGARKKYSVLGNILRNSAFFEKL